MNDFLRQVNEVWGLHDLDYSFTDPPEGGVGCLAFVLDDRFVEADFDPSVQMRLAATFGDNLYPEHRQRGWVEPDPAPGTFRFAIHQIGIRGKRITVFDMWMDDRPAGDCETAEDGERRCREILAAISDEQYSSMLEEKRGEAPPVKRSEPVDLTGFELIANEEHL